MAYYTRIMPAVKIAVLQIQPRATCWMRDTLVALSLSPERRLRSFVALRATKQTIEL